MRGSNETVRALINGQIEDAPAGRAVLSVVVDDSPTVELKLPGRLLAEYVSAGRQIEALKAQQANLMSGFIWGAGVDAARFTYTLNQESGAVQVMPLADEAGG